MSRLPLTRSQYEVLMLAAHGLRRREIAERLSVSESTVRNHIGQAYARLGARNQAEAFRVLGWLQPPPDYTADQTSRGTS